MAIDHELVQSKPLFYQRVGNLSDFQWRQDAGNRKDFFYKGYDGHVNWYGIDGIINRYGGHVCIVFKNIDSAHTVIPHPYGVHPNHEDWVIASSQDVAHRDVNNAVSWIREMAELFVNQNPRNAR